MAVAAVPFAARERPAAIPSPIPAAQPMLRGANRWAGTCKEQLMNTTHGLLIRAAAFAAERHRHQRRRDAEASPYINHPIALADVLVNEGGVDDPNALCAALLHDTIEDTQTSAAEIEALFGARIAAIV